MTETSEFLIFLGVFLLGGLIGFTICRIILGKKLTAAQQQELDESKAELEYYKSQVNHHFNSSAKLMEQVASSYQALYSHMAGQSQTLLGDAEMFPFPQLKMAAEEKPQERPIAEETPQEVTADKAEEEPATDTPQESSETESESREKEPNKQARSESEA